LILSDVFQRDYDTWSQLAFTTKSVNVALHVSGGARPQYIEAITNGTTPSGIHSNDPIVECTYSPETFPGSVAFWAGCTENNTCGSIEDLEYCIEEPTGCNGRSHRIDSGYQKGKLSANGIRTIMHYMIEYHPPPCKSTSLQLDTLGGKINEIGPTDTAFPHRNQTSTYQFIVFFDQGCDKPRMELWLKNIHEALSPFMSGGKYRNYANSQSSDYNQQYFLDNYKRLVEIKKQHDPRNIFSYSQSIPTFIEEVEEVVEEVGDVTESVLLFYWPYTVTGILLLVSVLTLCCLHKNYQQHEKKQ
jgi:hypothetical protein